VAVFGQHHDALSNEIPAKWSANSAKIYSSRDKSARILLVSSSVP
jgi:hypothetical protein